MNEDLNSKLTDAQLIERAKRGDHQSFGKLYERYIDAMFRYVRSRVDDVQTAEDITEAVFLRSFEAISKYREKGLRYSAYLYQVARNLLIDHYRRGDDTVPIENAEHQLISSQSTDGEIIFRKLAKYGW
jgi:RNA polymerase sigma-70 factor (ECF subfamily)